MEIDDSYQVIKLTDKDLIRLRVKKRRRIPYKEITELLIEGYDVFIPDMNRKTASYLRKRLTEILGVEVIAFPSEFQGMNGYTFKLRLIDKILQKYGETKNE